MDEVEAASSPEAHDRMTRILTALLAVLVLGQIVLLWLPRYLPTNDGPAHLYSAWVARQLADDAHNPLAKWFYPNPRVIYPNAGYSEFLQWCARFLPIERAERIALSLYFLALPLAVGFFARSLGRDPILPALFAAGLSFSWLFFLGFFNFLWGVPAVFGFLGVEASVLRHPTVRYLAVTNVLLIGIFWLHLVAFAVAVLSVGVLALVSRRIWTAAASVLPALLLCPLFWPRTVGVASHWKWKPSIVKWVTDALALNVASAFGGRERAVAVVVGLIIAGAAVWGLVEVRRGWVEVSLLAGVLFLAAIVAPEAIGAGSVLPARLALFGWLFLGLALDFRKESRRAGVAALLAAGMISHTVFIQQQFLEFDRTMATYMSGLELIPKGARTCSLTNVPKAQPFVVRPMATVAGYYYMELGSPNFAHYQAAPEQAPQFPVGYTDDALSYFVGEKPLARLSLPKISEWADYLVLWQPIPQQLTLLLTRDGYRVLAIRGDLTLLVHERIAGSGAG